MPKYTVEQKNAAIALALAIGARPAAAELGLPKSTVQDWVTKAKAAAKIETVTVEPVQDCGRDRYRATITETVGTTVGGFGDTEAEAVDDATATLARVRAFEAKANEPEADDIDRMAADCVRREAEIKAEEPEAPAGWTLIEASEPETEVILPVIADTVVEYSAPAAPVTKFRHDPTPTAWSESNYRRNVRLNQTPILAEAAHLARRTGRKVRRFLRSKAFALLAVLAIAMPLVLNLATARDRNRVHLGRDAAATARSIHPMVNLALQRGWVKATLRCTGHRMGGIGQE